MSTLSEATLRVDGWRLRLCDVDIDARDVVRALDVHGVLGSDVGAGRALRIDFRNGRFEILEAGRQRCPGDVACLT
ncbi:MAG UNVERIFIED_CONTAM: hypothetical protein LOD86_05740, partial [Thermobifida fusca]